jgi:hypothetical protein
MSKWRQFSPKATILKVFLIMGIFNRQMQLFGSCREYSTVCLNISNLIVWDGIHLKLQRRFKNDFQMIYGNIK